MPYDNYYAVILHRTKLSFSLKYFITLSIFLVIVELTGAFMGLAKSYPFLRTQSGLHDLISQIPDDLVVTLHNGKLMTNYDRPIIIFNPDIATPGTLVVIDQKAQKNKIYEYETRYLFTENELIANIDGQIMTFDYSHKKITNEPFSIPIGAVAKGSSSLIFLLYAAGILMLPFIITAGRLVLLTIISSVVFIVCLRLLPAIRAGKIFQLSLHAATAPVLIQTTASVLGLSIPLSFWWFNIMTTIFLIAGMYEAYVLSEKQPNTRT